jgi:fructuronate reductase
MKRLDPTTLPALAARGVRVPPYDRSRIRTGVLHFGPGAFHRVHQACYFDDALALDPRWGIAQVSLHSAGVRDALARQDRLYTIAVLDEASSYRVIGAVTEMLVAPESPEAVLARLADPAITLVTMTVTEKGYCLAADGGLDVAHPEIAHDLAHPEAPRSLIGYLAVGLGRRFKLGHPPPTILSCDNLTDNGGRLRRAMLDFAGRLNLQLARWIAADVAFPCTMVDSITPATDDALRARVAEQLGVEDRWPVQREAFMQWVVEDAMRGPHPDWEALGVTVTDDVAAFERAKLRLLNGAHSTLAYMGSLAGHETVADAMHDASLAPFVRTLMTEDIAPSLRAPRGLDIALYIEAILGRFRNPALRHLLSQIAWDGSQKLPFRLLGTIREALEAGRPIERLCTPIAAWMHFVRRKASQDDRLVDPLATQLLALGGACTGESSHDVRLFLGLEAVFPPELAQRGEFVAAVTSAYGRLAIA